MVVALFPVRTPFILATLFLNVAISAMTIAERGVAGQCYNLDNTVLLVFAVDG